MRSAELVRHASCGAAVGTAAGNGVGMRLLRNRNANGVCSRRAEGEEGWKTVVPVDSSIRIIYKVSADRRMKWPPIGTINHL